MGEEAVPVHVYNSKLTSIFFNTSAELMSEVSLPAALAGLDFGTPGRKAQSVNRFSTAGRRARAVLPEHWRRSMAYQAAPWLALSE